MKIFVRSNVLNLTATLHATDLTYVLYFESMEIEERDGVIQHSSMSDTEDVSLAQNLDTTLPSLCTQMGYR